MRAEDVSFTVTVRSTTEKRDQTVAESRVTTVTHAWDRSVDQVDTLCRNKNSASNDRDLSKIMSIVDYTQWLHRRLARCLYCGYGVPAGCDRTAYLF